MSRRTHVVRTGDAAGVSEYRAAADTTVLCYGVGNAGVGGDGPPVEFAPIEVIVDVPYRRFLLLATVSQVSVEWLDPEDPGQNTPAFVTMYFYCPDLGASLNAPVQIPDGSSGAMTAVVDLPSGGHTLCVQVLPYDVGTIVVLNSLDFQVVVAQGLESPGCDFYTS
jgi:hypothetical protein